MSDNEKRTEIIEDYISAYNNFDIENMLKNLDDGIVFRNVSNGEVDLTTNGIEEFRNQAEKATGLFSRREQKMTAIKFGEDTAEVEIAYNATLAVELPNGLKPGAEIELDGRSIFRFAGDKIIKIEDIS